MRSYRHRIVNFKFFSKQIEEKYIWNLENSLVHDSEAVVRAEMAKTIALLARRVNQSTDSESDLEKRSQKLTLQLMVDADSAVIESIVREMVEVVIEHDGTFREDFFIPQIGKLQ